MGWETRGGRSYYYRKERSGGRVRSVYVGGGQIAVFRAMLDKESRDEEDGRRAEARAARALDEAIDQTLEGLGGMIKTLQTAALLAEGFHTHKRQWRRTRDE